MTNALRQNTATLATIIESAWEQKDSINTDTKGEVRDAVSEALNLLDSGSVRIAEKTDGRWVVNQWLKKAVLLSFRLNAMVGITGGPGGSSWWDKVPSKFDGWRDDDFKNAAFRAVPNCVVRKSAYIAPNVVLMPSFVNLGAYVGEGTMIDTWSTVGSCAQTGKHCHISGGVGIGGVLEPLQALSWKKVPFCPWGYFLVPPPKSSTAKQARCSWDACLPTPSLFPGRFLPPRLCRTDRPPHL